MNDNKIERINELAKKSKSEGLTDSEKEEQAKLRKEYIEAFKKSLKSTLDNVIIVDEEGNETPVKQKGNNLPC